MRAHLFWLVVAIVAGIVAHTAFALFVPGWWFSRQVAALSHAHGKNSFFILSPEEQARLFEPFVRLDSHLRIKAGGTGLGLYLTRKIAREILLGELEVRSEKNRGSTFILRVPRRRPAQPGEGVPS